MGDELNNIGPGHWIKVSCGGGRKERRRRRSSGLEAVFILVYAFLQFTSGFSPGPTPVPDDCSTADFDGGLALTCRLSAVNSAEEKTNFTVIPAASTYKLRVLCQNSFLVSHLEADGFRSLVNLRQLRLQGCNFEDIPARAFWGLEELETLVVRTPSSGSPDTDSPAGDLKVEVDAFYGIQKLEVLDLSGNGIKRFNANVLCPLHNLKKLDLSSNKVRSISDVVVTNGCLGKVRVLDLSHNWLEGISLLNQWGTVTDLLLSHNQITAVSPDVFGMLSVSLKVLDLSANRLTSLPEAMLAKVHYLKTASFANNSISKVPKNLFRDQAGSLEVLDFSHNKLVRFDPEVFADLKRLKQLRLSHNNLQALHPQSLKGLESLELVNLGSNNLLVLPDSLFRQVPNLMSVDLSGNMLTALPENFFRFTPKLSSLLLAHNRLEAVDVDSMFRSNGALKVLDLSHNKLRNVTIGWKSSLRALQSLSLSHNYLKDLRIEAQMPSLWRLEVSHNGLANLSVPMVKFPSLQVADWSHNQIVAVPRNVFAKNQGLQAVRLDGNNLERIDGVFYNLPNLSWLNVSSNQIKVFDYAMVPESLKWLDIHQNAISGLENYFSKQIGLTFVDASFNKIKELGPQNIPDTIETLILNDNLIETLVPYSFFKKQSLQKVDLSLNKLHTIDRNSLRLSSELGAGPRPVFSLGGNPIKCDCHMSWFKTVNGDSSMQNFPVISDLESIYCQLLHSKDRSVVPLVDASSEDFLCTYKTHCFALCHCCDYDACDCEMTCPNNCTCYHDNSWSKNIAECSSENLTDLPDQLPMDATEIFLDDNNIRELKSHNFIGRKNLKTLFLNHSKIYRVENHTFNGLSSLIELHLEDNILTKLEGDEFQGLSELRSLYLHNNFLKAIGNTTFRELHSLAHLTLHGNKLVEFGVWHLAANQLLMRVSLAGNRWTCECKFIDQFQSWMKSFRGVVVDKRHLFCSPNILIGGRDEDHILIIDRNVTSCLELSAMVTHTTMDNQGGLGAKGSSSPHKYLPALISSVSLIVLVTVLLGVAYVYRSDLRIWFYTKYGVRFFQRIDSVADAEKVFDAFVAYSGADDVFVRQILSPELEHGGKYVPYPMRYKLCLFYRDLPPQVCVPDLILQATEASRRTVVVLSENFLKCEWARYEFKSGLLQSLQATGGGGTWGRRRLIFVVLGEIREIQDPELRLYLKAGTVLQWGDKAFWEKLCYLLPDVASHQPAEDTYSFRYETVPRRAYAQSSEGESTRTMTIHI